MFSQVENSKEDKRRVVSNGLAPRLQLIQKEENNAGLLNNVKSTIDNPSDLPIDHFSGHYNWKASKGAPPIQCYWASNDKKWRVADDNSVAVRQDYWAGSQVLYAKAGKAEFSNQILRSQNSVIRLRETSTILNVDNTSLKKIETDNHLSRTGKTYGNDMKSLSDCGACAGQVTGAYEMRNYGDVLSEVVSASSRTTTRRGVYNNPQFNHERTSKATDVFDIKSEIYQYILSDRQKKIEKEHQKWDLEKRRVAGDLRVLADELGPLNKLVSIEVDKRKEAKRLSTLLTLYAEADMNNRASYGRITSQLKELSAWLDWVDQNYTEAQKRNIADYNIGVSKETDLIKEKQNLSNRTSEYRGWLQSSSDVQDFLNRLPEYKQKITILNENIQRLEKQYLLLDKKIKIHDREITKLKRTFLESQLARPDPDGRNLKENKSKPLADFFESLDSKTKEDYAKALKINEYAEPDIGEAFVVTRGGKSLGKPAWNFHWAGIVLKSDDNKDKVSLENDASTKPKPENTKWRFQLYGQEKQSFHAEMKGFGEFNSNPMTIRIRNG